MKKPRLSVAEKIQARQEGGAPSAPMDLRHIANLCVGARRGLQSLTGSDMVNVATSLALVEEWLTKAGKPTENPPTDQQVAAQQSEAKGA